MGDAAGPTGDGKRRGGRRSRMGGTPRIQRQRAATNKSITMIFLAEPCGSRINVEKLLSTGSVRARLAGNLETGRQWESQPLLQFTESRARAPGRRAPCSRTPQAPM